MHIKWTFFCHAFQKPGSISSKPTVAPVSIQPTTSGAHVRASMPSLDTIFDDSHDTLPTWARNKLDSLTEVPINATNTTADNHKAPKMKTSASFDQQPVRRSRAVWGPSTAMNFAVMDETESQHSETRSSPVFAIQSPSIDEKFSDEIVLAQDSDNETLTITHTTATTNVSTSNSIEKTQSQPADLDYKIVENEEILSNSVASSALSSPKFYVESNTSGLQAKRDEVVAVVPKISLLDTSNSSSKSENSFSLGSFRQASGEMLDAIKLECDMDNSFRRQSISARLVFLKWDSLLSILQNTQFEFFT